MCKVSDVANFFVRLSLGGEEDFITNLKLNKLLYFAQGWSLVRLGKPLFQNDIQAWKYGPVVASVYHDYKNCGCSPITFVDEGYLNSVFSGDQYALLLDVYAEYGRFTARALTSMTHESGTPWSLYYVEGENAVIPKEAIRDYFQLLPELKKFNSSMIDESEIEGRFDPVLGYYVLPADDEDEGYYDI